MAIQYYADQNIEGKLTVSTVLRVNDSGSSIKGVGINTMNPGGELQVVGGSTGIGNIYLSANAAGSSVTDSLHIKKEGTKASIINRDSGDLSFGANDNNDYVTIKGTGKVGMGTTSPSQKLEVSEEGQLVSKFVGNTNDGTGFIGAVVEIETNIDTRGRGIYLTHRDSSDTSDSEWYMGTPYSGGGLSIGNAAYGTSINSATGPAHKDQSKLFIAESGNVGIGTTSPGNELQVGNFGSTETPEITVGGGTSSQIQLTTSAATGSFAQVGFGSTQFASSNTAGKIKYTHTSQTNPPLDVMSFRVNYSDKMVINGSGNVGIGTTSPDSKLNIEGTKNTAILTLGNTTSGSTWVVGDRVGGIDFYSADGSGGGIGVKASISYEEAVGGTGSSQAMVFRTGGNTSGTNNVERMRLQYNGYVGIGTDSPQEKVHVVEAVPGNTLLEVENTRTNSSAGIKLTSGSNNYIAYTSSAGNFEIFNTQTGKVNFVIAANGQGSFGNAVDTITNSAFSVAGGGGIRATKYINQRVVWATGFSHATNNSSAYYYFPVAGYLLTTTNQYYNGWIAPYAGRVKRITIRNVSGTSSAPTATTVNFRVSVNGSVIYTGANVTIVGSTYNKYAMEDISANDALFVASDRIQVAFRTNGLWRNAAASISLEYTE